MAEILEFDFAHEYSIYKEGITVETILQSGEESIIFEAKVDIGSTYTEINWLGVFSFRVDSC